MTEPSSPLPPDPPGTSMDRVRDLVQSLLRYVAARGLLLQIEAKEAGGVLAGLVIGAIIGLGALAGAWLLLLPAAVSYAARMFHQPWEYIAAGVGALHLLIALILLLRLKSGLKGLKLFEETLNQFERDREWVASTKTQPK